MAHTVMQSNWACMLSLSLLLLSSTSSKVKAAASPFTAGLLDTSGQTLATSTPVLGATTSPTSTSTVVVTVTPTPTTDLDVPKATLALDSPAIAAPLQSPNAAVQLSDPPAITPTDILETATATLGAPNLSPRPFGLNGGHGPVVTSGAQDLTLSLPGQSNVAEPPKTVYITTGGNGPSVVTSYINTGGAGAGDQTTSIPRTTTFLTVSASATQTRAKTTITQDWLTSAVVPTVTVSARPSIVKNSAAGDRILGNPSTWMMMFTMFGPGMLACLWWL